MAEALLDSAERIIGKSKSISCFCVDWGGNLETVKQRLDAAIHDADQGDGVLLLTDMFGGTSTNIALDYQQPGKVEVITGVNLPMIVKALTLPKGTTVADAATKLRDQGRKAIHIASDRR
jgi:PTS system mannose-specific IIA component